MNTNKERDKKEREFNALPSVLLPLTTQTQAQHKQRQLGFDLRKEIEETEPETRGNEREPTDPGAAYCCLCGAYMYWNLPW